MACLIDQELTFYEGSSDGIPELSYDNSIDYSKFIAIVNNVEIPFYKVDDSGDSVYVGFAAGENVAPSLVIWFPNGQDTYITYSAVQGQAFEGEATVSICEKESDSDACPDVPFSESAPEQYADYFDEYGNFVPKGNSGGAEENSGGAEE